MSVKKSQYLRGGIGAVPSGDCPAGLGGGVERSIDA
jgi:hypothetical protein